jgi:hypothetical protein
MMRSISVCHRDECAYNWQVRLFWQIHCLFWLAALSLALTGCGGITATKSVSPASFFMPGIMKAAPTPAECTNQFAWGGSEVR